MWKEDQSPRVKKERKSTLTGMWENASSGRHMDNLPKETHAVSVMTQWPPAAVAKSETMRTIVFSRAKFEGKDGEGEKNPQKKSGNKEEGSADKRSEIPCRYKTCKNRHVNFGILPCVKSTSLRTDANMDRSVL